MFEITDSKFLKSKTVVTDNICNELQSISSAKDSIILSRFFKTGKGEYGEGDKFLGVRVPKTRFVVKKHINETTIADINILTLSEWHEVRLAGFLLLIEKFKVACKENDLKKQEEIVQTYLHFLPRGNNWDLVDIVSPKILGEWIVRNPHQSKILYSLAEYENLWVQRVAIVSTLALVRNNYFEHTLSLSKQLLNHQHDLIHKAVGWLLREIWKKNNIILEKFLDENITEMPRVTLRYSIERMPMEKKKHYMSSQKQLIEYVDF